MILILVKYWIKVLYVKMWKIVGFVKILINSFLIIFGKLKVVVICVFNFVSNKIKINCKR